MENICTNCKMQVPRGSKWDSICCTKCFNIMKMKFRDMRIFNKTTTKRAAYGIGYDRGYQQAIVDFNIQDCDMPIEDEDL